MSAGRTSTGLLKKGYKLTKGGSVVKAKKRKKHHRRKR